MASAALLAILVALGSVAATPETFAQQKQQTMQERFEDGAAKSKIRITKAVSQFLKNLSLNAEIVLATTKSHH